MLVPDLQAFSWLMRCKVFLVGADAWCEDGLVHKVGTKHLAVVANQAGVPGLERWDFGEAIAFGLGRANEGRCTAHLPSANRSRPNPLRPD